MRWCIYIYSESITVALDKIYNNQNYVLSEMIVIIIYLLRVNRALYIYIYIER